ncbi:hypothetical protein [Rhizobium sp. ZPR3]|uniref:DUF932 domain-containing protein n=2 Tax=unclassified Rhizobium TaxID=2613769 RepID=A0AAU7S9Z3_9HYPH
MSHTKILIPAEDRVGGYKLDSRRGDRVGRISSKWFERPADERYLSMSDLYAIVHGRAEHSRTRILETGAIRIEARRDSVEYLALLLSNADLQGFHRLPPMASNDYS